jgi:hypothetical protein
LRGARLEKGAAGRTAEARAQNFAQGSPGNAQEDRDSGPEKSFLGTRGGIVRRWNRRAGHVPFQTKITRLNGCLYTYSW